MTALILLYIIGALHQAQHTLEMVLSESDDLPEDENEPAINEYADIANGDIVENLMNQMNAGRPKKLTNPGIPGAKLLVKVYGDYSRGILMDDGAIYLIDTGMTVNVDMDSLCKLPPRFQSEKRMAVPLKLATPEKMSDEEKSGVSTHLSKWLRNRFMITSRTHCIYPYSRVELLHLSSGISLTNDCIEERLYMRDVPKKKVDTKNATVHIVDNQYISKFFISCVMENDFQRFVEIFNDMQQYGDTIINAKPYIPEKLEICLALVPDNDRISSY